MSAAIRSQPRGAGCTKALLASLVSPVAICLVLTAILVVASSAAASAQFLLADPDGTIKGLAAGWATQAISWAQHIYILLLAFELIALAVTTLLFRENLAEFFASVGLKVFVGGIYFWFIINAGVGGWPAQIVGTFQSIGSTLAFHTPLNNPTTLPSATSWVTVDGLTAAGAYFAAGPAAQLVSQTAGTAIATTAGTTASTAAAAGPIAAATAALNMPCIVAIPMGAGTISCPGYATAAPILASLPALEQSAYQTAYQAAYQPYNQSYPFTLITEGMGLMLVMALAAIWLQIIIMTIESYIVMGAGVLFIGFASSRFTMPFSQGYFSYMFNVGVKFMVLYIVLGIEQSLMAGPTGILSSAIATLATAVAAAAIPGGEYAALAVAAVGMLNVIIAAALVWMLPGLAGSFLSGQSSASGSAILGQVMGQLASTAGMVAQLHKSSADGGARKSGAPLKSQASSGSKDPAPGYETTDPADQAMTSSAAVSPPTGGLGTGQSPLPGRGAATHANAELDRASALYYLAQAAPRDIGQPGAVQVRLANPDKL